MRSAASKTYVLDTSVLLAAPNAYEHFDEHEVVIPVAVLIELEGKRHHERLGWAARQSLRGLEALRVKHGTLTSALPVNDLGGTVRVEMNHQDISRIPEALADGSPDARILTVAHNLAAEGKHAVLVSKDLPLRLRAGVAGIEAEEYKAEQHPAEAWSGVETLEVDYGVIDSLFAGNESSIDAVGADPALHVNTGLVLRSGTQSALARVKANGVVRLIPDQRAFDVEPRSANQRFALDLLLDDSVGVVSLCGAAGTGKTLLAIAAGLQKVYEDRTMRKVIVFRPTTAMGGEELGFLPGTLEEKMSVWETAVIDVLEAITNKHVIDDLRARNLLEVAPVSFLRGRTIGPNVYAVIDEAQNLEASTLVGVMTRMGQGSRIVCAYDPDQRDSLRVGRYDGIIAMANRFRGHHLFGHVTLDRQERSEIAKLAASFLQEPGDE